MKTHPRPRKDTNLSWFNFATHRGPRPLPTRYENEAKTPTSQIHEARTNRTPLTSKNPKTWRPRSSHVLPPLKSSATKSTAGLCSGFAASSPGAEPSKTAFWKNAAIFKAASCDDMDEFRIEMNPK